MCDPTVILGATTLASTSLQMSALSQFDSIRDLKVHGAGLEIASTFIRGAADTTLAFIEDRTKKKP